MNETLVVNWNERVENGDRVYHLGDISFGKPQETEEILKRLKGQIFVIKGNHDWRTAYNNVPRNIIWMRPYEEIKVTQQRLILFHYPILSWNQMHRGSWMLHGHCHGNLSFDNGPMLDVGVDCHNFAPIEFSEIQELLQDKEIKEYDHHKHKEGAVTNS